MLCHTSLSALTDSFATNYDGNTPVVVKSADPLTINPSVGWYSIPGITAFDYNGTDNLIVEVRWTGSDSVSYDAHFANRAVNRNLFSGESTATTGTVAAMNVRLKIKITNVAIENSSLGELKAIFK